MDLATRLKHLTAAGLATVLAVLFALQILIAIAETHGPLPGKEISHGTD